jgi:hypothetical protein
MPRGTPARYNQPGNADADGDADRKKDKNAFKKK